MMTSEFSIANSSSVWSDSRCVSGSRSLHKCTSDVAEDKTKSFRESPQPLGMEDTSLQLHGHTYRDVPLDRAWCFCFLVQWVSPTSGLHVHRRTERSRKTRQNDWKQAKREESEERRAVPTSFEPKFTYREKVPGNDLGHWKPYKGLHTTRVMFILGTLSQSLQLPLTPRTWGEYVTVTRQISTLSKRQEWIRDLLSLLVKRREDVITEKRPIEM